MLPMRADTFAPDLGSSILFESVPFLLFLVVLLALSPPDFASADEAGDKLLLPPEEDALPPALL